MLNECPIEIDFDVYQPRNPKASAYYRCVEDHFGQLETVWDDRYQGRLGFWRPYVTDVIRRYLDCGDLHFGFARVKCEDWWRLGSSIHSMKIISFIEDQQIIEKILHHLDLWHVKRKPPARANGPPTETFIIYDQSSSPSADDYLIDADYPIETYL